MVNGEKTKIEKNVKKSIKFFQKTNKKDHKEILKRSIIESAPIIKLREMGSKRKKQKRAAFPYVVQPENRISLGMKSITKEKTNPLYLNLFKEMVLRLKSNNDISRKKEENYKTSLSYKKSAFFRWFF